MSELFKGDRPTADAASVHHKVDGRWQRAMTLQDHLKELADAG